MAISFTSELTVVGMGAYLSYTSIGTPVSNASGTVIRSTVTSGLYPFILVIGFSLFGLDLSARLASSNTAALKYMLISGLISAAVFLPPLIYYNFYYSYETVMGGTVYTVYPYAVQPGIPFLFSIFFSFMALIQMISQWSNRRRSRLNPRQVVRISSEGVEFGKEAIRSSREEK